MTDMVLTVEKIRDGGLVFFPSPSFHLAGDLRSRAHVACSQVMPALTSLEQVQTLSPVSASEWSLRLVQNDNGQMELECLRCLDAHKVPCQKLCRAIALALRDYFAHMDNAS